MSENCDHNQCSEYCEDGQRGEHQMHSPCNEWQQIQTRQFQQEENQSHTTHLANVANQANIVHTANTCKRVNLASAFSVEDVVNPGHLCTCSRYQYGEYSEYDNVNAANAVRSVTCPAFPTSFWGFQKLPNPLQELPTRLHESSQSQHSTCYEYGEENGWWQLQASHSRLWHTMPDIKKIV